MGTRVPFSARLSVTFFVLWAFTTALGVFPQAGLHGIGTAAAGGPMVELMSGGDVIGDGQSPVTLSIIAFNANGTAMKAASLRVSTQSGSVGKVNQVQPGLYNVSWTPPKVTAKTDIELTIRGRGDDKSTIQKSWVIGVSPALALQLSVTANPSHLTLGQDSGSTLSIQLGDGSVQTHTEPSLLISASSGTVDNITHLGGGKFAASYRPESGKFFPHLALITIADKRDPSRTYGSVAIPMIGKANFPVVGQPNGTVMIRIDDREFGPTSTDVSGRAQVPIEVRPGYNNATLISIIDGKKTEEALDLQIPLANRVTLFPVAVSIPADPEIGVAIRAFVGTQSGPPDGTARVSFSTTAGQIGSAVHEGNGVYMATFKPPFGSNAAQATIQVEVEDLAFRQIAATTVNLIPIRPGNVALTPEPASLSKEASAFQILAKITGSDNVGMPGRSLSFTVTGGRQNGDTQDLGSGDYQAKFGTTGKGPVELIATARTQASENPVQRVLLFPAQIRLPNDGLSSTMLTVLSLDEFGYPVANTPVELKVVTGEGSLPATTTTDNAGIAQVHFTAGRKAGITTISASARGHTAMIPMLLAPDKVAVDYVLPASGSATTVAHFEAWRKIVRAVRLEREGMAGAAIAGVIAAPTVGPISAVNATSDPAEAAPGGTVTIMISATDANGRGVGGRSIQVLASPGEVSAITDQGGGKYQATVTIPAGVAGTAKLSIVAPNAGVATTLDIPISGGSWQAVGTADQSTEDKAKPKKEPREKGDYPLFRGGVGIALGGYSYRQQPVVEHGPLYDYAVTFGGDATKPAPSPGVKLDARLWIPGVKYVGAEASFRTSHYAVTLPEFDSPITDWVNEFKVRGIGRYPHQIGEVQVHAGLRMGMSWDDFLIYRQSGEKELRVLEYAPLVITALELGPEIGVEWDGGVFGHTGLDFGLAGGTNYYKLSWDLRLGYSFIDNAYAFFDTNIVRRETAIYLSPDGGGAKTQVGVVSDHLSLFILGAGIQL